MGVPGFILRSFATDENGAPDLNDGISEVTHRTPIEERWGGWYVTGKHGRQTHRGNLIGKTAFEQQTNSPNYLGDVQDLKKFLDVSKYPEKSSDIVALLVLEHQAHMHNFITRLRYESEMKLAAYGHINYVTNIANAFLKYMLFADEAPMKSRIEGNSSFTRDFEKLGPFDSQGRSLRQFDLQTRLFKYPCSYLVYSKAFDALPQPMKEYLYKRLYDILNNQDASPDFDGIPRRTKREIFEILSDTKPEMAAFWKQQTGS
jgi:hypothetical protein